MRERKWKVDVKADDGTDISAQISAELEALIEATRLDDIAPGRISVLFFLNLFGASQAGKVNPFRIATEISSLEKNEPNGLKPAMQNRHQPLKGLWHKHYMQTDKRAMAINVQHGLKQFGIPYLQRKVQEAKQSGEQRYFTVDDVVPLTMDAVHGNWKRLQEAEKLTGEWIVFAKHEGKNYYLCLATHDKSTHPALRQQIDAIAVREFPFLEALLKGSD